MAGRVSAEESEKEPLGGRRAARGGGARVRGRRRGGPAEGISRRKGAGAFGLGGAGTAIYDGGNVAFGLFVFEIRIRVR